MPFNFCALCVKIEKKLAKLLFPLSCPSEHFEIDNLGETKQTLFSIDFFRLIPSSSAMSALMHSQLRRYDCIYFACSSLVLMSS